MFSTFRWRKSIRISPSDLLAVTPAVNLMTFSSAIDGCNWSRALELLQRLPLVLQLVDFSEVSME